MYKQPTRRGSPLHKAVKNQEPERISEILTRQNNYLDSKDVYGRTPLHYAILYKFELGVDLILAGGAAIDIMDLNGNTPLHYAILIKNHYILMALLEHGTDIHSKNMKGTTPLHLTAIKKFHSAMSQLLSRGANVDEVDDAGNSPLRYAALKKDITVLQLLLDKHAFVNIKNSNGETAFLQTVIGNFYPGVRCLLENKAKVNETDNRGKTPVHYAVGNRNSTILKLFIEEGAELELADKKGRTPLVFAAKVDCFPAVSLLLNNVVDVNVIDTFGKTALHYSIENANAKVFEALLEIGAKVEKNETFRFLPLSAAKHNFTQGFLFFCNKGFSIDLKDVEGKTPLHYAVINGNEEIIKEIRKQKSEAYLKKDDEGLMNSALEPENNEFLQWSDLLKAQDNEGKGPLHHAVINGDDQIVKAILEPENADFLLWGVLLKAQDNEGKTPLHYAAINRNEQITMVIFKQNLKSCFSECVEWSLNSALNPEHGELLQWSDILIAQDKEGKTPLHYAVINENEEIIQLFLGKNPEAYLNGSVKEVKYTESEPELGRSLQWVNLLHFQDYTQRTALDYAVVSENEQIVKLILQKCSKVALCEKVTKGLNNSLSENKHDGVLQNAIGNKKTALHYAVLIKHSNILKALLENGFNVDAADERGKTPFQLAIDNLFEQGIKMMLSKTSNVNFKTKYGKSLLHLAVEVQSEEGMQYLLQKGIKANCRDDHGNTPLHLAAKQNFITGIEILLQEGIDIESENKTKDSPLCFAMNGANIDVLDKMLQNNANLEHKNAFNETPFHMALYFNDVEIIKKCLERNPNVNSVGYFGNSPLFIAIKKDNVSVVKHLLEKGSDVRHSNKCGQTPLHIAAAYNSNLNIVQMLLESEADVNAMDARGRTPLYYVLDFRSRLYNVELFKELLDWGGFIKEGSNDFLPMYLFIEEMNNDFFEDSYQLTSILIQYITRSQIAGFAFFLSAYPRDVCQPGLDEYQLRCLQEIELMKQYKFGLSSLVDVFYKRSDPRYVLNEQITSMIHSPLLYAEFPIYASLLKSVFIKGKMRLKLLDDAQDNFNIGIPREITRYILSFLCNEELRKLTDK